MRATPPPTDWPTPGHDADWLKRRLRIFTEVAYAIAQSSTTSELLQSVGRTLDREGEMATIFTLSGDGSSLEWGYSWVNDFAADAMQQTRELARHLLHQLPLPTSPDCAVIQVLRDGQARLQENAFEDMAILMPRISAHRKRLMALFPSWRTIYAPIRSQRETIGLLMVAGEHLQTRDCEPVAALADLLATMIQGLGRTAHLALRHEQLSLIDRIAQEVNSSGPSRDQLAAATVGILTDHPGCTRAGLQLWNPEMIDHAAGDDLGRGTVTTSLPEPFLNRVILSDTPLFAAVPMRELAGNIHHDDGDMASLLAVRLKSDAEARNACGVLWMQGDGPDAFDESDAATIRTIARTIETGLHNITLFDNIDHQLESQIRLLQAQEQLGRAVTSSLDYDEVLRRLLDWTTRSLGAERSALLLIDELTETLHIPYCVGSEQEDIIGYRGPLQGSLTGWVLENRRPACIPDTQHPGSFEPYLYHKSGHTLPRSLLFVPLLRGEKVIGALGMMNKRVGPFSDEDVAFVQSISPWATIAIQNAALHRESQEQTARFEQAVDQAGRALALGADSMETLETIMRLAEELLDADASSVAYLTDNGRSRQYLAATGDVRHLIPMKLPLQGSLSELALTTREVVASEDIQSDERIDDKANATATGMHAAAVAGLWERDAPLGMLTLYRRESRPFSEADRQLLKTFADQAALAVVHARLADQRSEQASKLAALLDTTGEAIVVIDREGGIEYVNSVACEFLPQLQLVGPDVAAAGAGKNRRPSYTGYPADCPLLSQALERIQAGELISFEMTMPDARGRQRNLLVRLSELGPRQSCLIMASDVTEERRHDRLRFEFLRNIFHEVQTPLAGILGSTQLLKDQAGLTAEDRRHLVQQALQGAKRLQILIEDLQSYARLSDPMSLGPEAISDPSAAIEESVADMRRAHPEAQFEVEVRAPMPAVSLNGRELRRVLRHLLDNAIKFSPAGRPVEVRARRVRDLIQISVRDRGIGIAEDRHSEIFDPFHQLDDRTERRYPGVGLGLPLVHYVVEAAGGSIDVVSAPNEGSTFTITLPIAAGE